MAPTRRAAKRRGPGLRPGAVLSALLHLGFAALVVLASLRREKPPSPDSPPAAYAMVFEGGAPDQPADPEAASPLTRPEAAATHPEADEATMPQPPVAATTEPPAPALDLAPPAELAPPPRAEDPRTAEAEQPQPEDLPMPPPPAPTQPQREAALTAPPRPARPPPPELLPGLFLPQARSLQPAPPLPPGQRYSLDLAPGHRARPGRDPAEPQMFLRGANAGPDWYAALRRWWIDNRRPPPNADFLEEGGSSTVEMALAPDGRVKSVRLVRPSGSIWLDAGAVSQFRGALLPALPPGADPSGATLTFTINYILVR